MFQRQIFRKKSIERFGTPEKLDELLKVTSPKSWLILISLLLIIIIILIWTLFGTITTKALGTGIFNHPNQHLTALYAGQVDSIFVNNGDDVLKGQIVAKIIPEDVLHNISNSGTNLFSTEHDSASSSENHKKIKKKVEEYMNEMAPGCYVRSTVDGKIAETRITEGSFIEARSILFSIQRIKSGSTPQVTFFVDGFNISKMRPGMDILTTVSDAGGKNSFTGKVVQVSAFPASHERLTSVLENNNLVQNVEFENPYEIVAGIDIPTGTDLEEFNTHNGKICHVEVIIKKSRPINLLFSK